MDSFYALLGPVIAGTIMIVVIIKNRPLKKE